MNGPDTQIQPRRQSLAAPLTRFQPSLQERRQIHCAMSEREEVHSVIANLVKYQVWESPQLNSPDFAFPHGKSKRNGDG